ncbi:MULTISPECIES: hypothetical protein [Nitrosopumilus]|uniref:Uncharacterized protein n=1 Tax=Nitrosopumilus piranensis TaxID=1582439 RepID=A0A0C5BVK3_9ARCH|nr:MULTISPECIES: hypothetical protein [Nitrosopumilus]AJM92286.1 hypothetical protein NPIRD3C_1074 [Nitrosopumilus piranensis]KAF6244230.1 hypothetical protein C6989_08005 [Nitrosopumilus sp. b2]
MTQTQNNEKIKYYEDLQKEYEKLAAEYRDIESTSPHSLALSEKIKEMLEKQKEIHKLSLELV